MGPTATASSRERWGGPEAGSDRYKAGTQRYVNCSKDIPPGADIHLCIVEQLSCNFASRTAWDISVRNEPTECIAVQKLQEGCSGVCGMTTKPTAVITHQNVTNSFESWTPVLHIPQKDHHQFVASSFVLKASLPNDAESFLCARGAAVNHPKCVPNPLEPICLPCPLQGQQSATFGHVWPVCVIPHGLRGVPASSKLLDKEGAGAEAYKIDRCVEPAKWWQGKHGLANNGVGDFKHWHSSLQLYASFKTCAYNEIVLYSSYVPAKGIIPKSLFSALLLGSVEVAWLELLIPRPGIAIKLMTA
eukprot:1156815-Pelagomonas_calceolata.AAC.1